jgi:hypothetical protein
MNLLSFYTVRKSVKNMWKTITWENCGKIVKKIVWKRIAWEKCGKY